MKISHVGRCLGGTSEIFRCLGGALTAMLIAGCSAGESTPEQELDDEALGSVSQEIYNGNWVHPLEEDMGSPFMPQTGCSSVLLRDRWVMSVAHCASFPTTFRLNGITRNAVRTPFIDPRNTGAPNYQWDVALYYLDGPLVPSGGTATTRGPYPIYRGAPISLLYQTLLCQGWGDCGPCVNTPYGTVQKANLQVTDSTTYADKFKLSVNGSGQIQRSGDSGSSCMTMPSNVQHRRTTGVDSHGTATDVWFIAPWTIRDWANGIIGTAPTLGVSAGYERSDLVSAVAFRTGGSIRELRKGSGNWTIATLPLLGGAVSNLATYVRPDGYSSVVARNASNHIYELAMFPGGNYVAYSLAGVPGFQPASGNPAAFVRADGVPTIVFRGASAGLAHELFLIGSTWTFRNLPQNDLGGAAPSDLIGHVRADGQSAIVYRGRDNHIHQLTMAFPATVWSAWDLWSFASGSPALAKGTPRPYTRSDGVTAIVYRDANDHIWELSLNAITGTGWAALDLTQNYGGPVAWSDPVGYVRADGTPAIVYLGSDSKVREFALTSTGWVNSNLQSICGNNAPNPDLGASAAPNAYVRADRVSAVTYRSGSHLWELSLPFGASCWAKKNMTQEAGTTL